MEALIITKTIDTPEICLNKASGKFEFLGKSLPEDVSAFYAPVLNWIQVYSENPNPETVVAFKMKYFNTASSKIILDILLKLEEIKQNGNNILVEWHHGENDEDMKEAGEEYSEMVEVPFKFIII